MTKAAFDKIMRYIEMGKMKGIVVGGNGNDFKGMVSLNQRSLQIDEDARIMQEEIFGPVVAFCKANDFNDAIEIANNTDYGLTGAVISNNREHIEKHVKIFMLEICT